MKDLQIHMLKGPDRVRKRPAVIFGAEGTEGLRNAVAELLELFATEGLLGHCTQLSVVRRGPELEILGDDRGILLDKDWENRFCRLSPEPAYPRKSDACVALIDPVHRALFGEEDARDAAGYLADYGHLGLYALQCVCEYLELQVIREGFKSTLRFEKGFPVGGLRRKASHGARGTRFRFLPDPEVFPRNILPDSFFTEALDTLAMLTPGLRCRYTDGQTGLAREFFYPQGIADFAARASAAPVYFKQIDARGRERYNRPEYEARVALAVSYTPYAPALKCFHNFREMTYGGTHMEQLRQQLCKGFADCLGLDSLSFAALSRHLTIVLVTRCPSQCTAWENGTRRSIGSRLLTDMTYDAAGGDFRNYLYTNKEHYQKMTQQLAGGHGYVSK